jgi:hypothetical protein
VINEQDQFNDDWSYAGFPDCWDSQKHKAKKEAEYHNDVVFFLLALRSIPNSAEIEKMCIDSKRLRTQLPCDGIWKELRLLVPKIFSE